MEKAKSDWGRFPITRRVHGGPPRAQCVTRSMVAAPAPMTISNIRANRPRLCGGSRYCPARTGFSFRVPSLCARDKRLHGINLEFRFKYEFNFPR